MYNFVAIFHHQFDCRPPPNTEPACPDKCWTTQCNACYYSTIPLETPSDCDNKACTGERFTRCLRSWASCVKRRSGQQTIVRDITC